MALYYPITNLLPPDFNILWDIKTLDEIIQMVDEGWVNGSDVRPTDLIELFRELKLPIPKVLKQFESTVIIKLPEDLYEDLNNVAILKYGGDIVKLITSVLTDYSTEQGKENNE